MAVKVTLNIYSGRPNPEWTLERGQVTRLRKHLKKIGDRHTNQLPAAPGLGGFRLCAEDESGLSETTVVYAGVVRTGDGDYLDEGRSLEKWLLESAPDLGELKAFVRSEVDRAW